jgi:hypothetical protein
MQCRDHTVPTSPPRRWAVPSCLLVAVALALPTPARAGDLEGQEALRLRAPDSVVTGRRAELDAPRPPTAATMAGPDLGFDLLGPDQPADAQAPKVDEGKLALRRKLLTFHPLLGIGLLACETATVVVGQLNYSDRFGGGPSSGRYERAHLLLAISTAVLHVGTGTLALLAPNPLGKKHQGVDRVLLHKIGMFTASAGMATEIALGIYTTRREGYLNQESFARAHLAIGYVTLAATYLGVGSLVF